jgi:hypothetical protein
MIAEGIERMRVASSKIHLAHAENRRDASPGANFPPIVAESVADFRCRQESYWDNLRSGST